MKRIVPLLCGAYFLAVGITVIGALIFAHGKWVEAGRPRYFPLKDIQMPFLGTRVDADAEGLRGTYFVED